MVDSCSIGILVVTIVQCAFAPRGRQEGEGGAEQPCPRLVVLTGRSLLELFSFHCLHAGWQQQQSGRCVNAAWVEYLWQPTFQNGTTGRKRQVLEVFYPKSLFFSCELVEFLKEISEHPRQRVVVAGCGSRGFPGAQVGFWRLLGLFVNKEGSYFNFWLCFLTKNNHKHFP